MIITLSQFQDSLAVGLALVLATILVQQLAGYIRRHKFIIAKGCQAAQKHVKLRDPYIGLDFLFDQIFKRTPDTYLDNAHQDFIRLGQTYTAKRWTYETIYTCNKENIKQMLAVGFDDFELPGIRVAAMGSLLGRGIFTLNGPAWSHARGLLRPSFTKQNLDPLNGLLEKHFASFIDRIPKDGTQIDLQPLFFELTMDVATDFLMGKSTNMLNRNKTHAREQQFVDDYMVCSFFCSQKMQWGPLHGLVFSKEAYEAKNRVLKYVDDYVDEFLNRKEDAVQARYDVLQELAKSTQDRIVLRDQVLHVLLASRDTAASLLSNFFFALARKPEVYRKLREEVLACAGKDGVTTEQLREMTYLKWCTQEALRLYPVVPTNARGATRDTIIPQGGGPDGKSALFIRKGGVVVYNLYSLHRDPEVYGEDPEDFRPERWDGIRPGWSYLPFSGGPRICIGQHYALKELHYIVARFVQTFETMESRDGSAWTELYALVMTCKNGVHVSLREPQESS